MSTATPASSERQGSAAAAVRVAVAIPCYNEAAAIAAVVAEYRQALPNAKIVVFDNNSSDGSAALAQEAGAEVIAVAQQGKGYVVRQAFELLQECDVLVLTDGDGTYPGAEAHRLIELVSKHGVDMAVAARRPVAGAQAMSPVRGAGNLLLKTAFRVLIGPGNTDLLSGYRAFSKRFRAEATLHSTGFEIETELASEAAARRLKVAEIPISYHPRIAGTVSKLRAMRDGRKILAAMLRHAARLRPARLTILSAALACAVATPWIPLAAAISAALFLWLAAILILETRRPQPHTQE